MLGTIKCPQHFIAIKDRIKLVFDTVSYEYFNQKLFVSVVISTCFTIEHVVCHGVHNMISIEVFYCLITWFHLSYSINYSIRIN